MIAGYPDSDIRDSDRAGAEVPSTRAEPYAANEEPRLGELLADPLTERLMASDGVQRDNLARLLENARRRLDEVV